MKSEAKRGDGHFVALLRGINVGRAKRVPMAELRELVTELGYAQVKTLLNSGNIVFSAEIADTTIAATSIQEAIEDRFGVSARVTVLTARELEAAVQGNSLVSMAENPSRLFVSFLADAKSQALVEPLLESDWAPCALALGPGVAYLWCPEGALSCPLYDRFTKQLGDSVTSRNWRTTLKIQAALVALETV